MSNWGRPERFVGRREIIAWGLLAGRGLSDTCSISPLRAQSTRRKAECRRREAESRRQEAVGGRQGVGGRGWL